MNGFIKTLAALLTSKKFLVLFGTIVGLIGSGASGAQPWAYVIAEICVAVSAYLIAQGQADQGKEKAKIENGKE